MARPGPRNDNAQARVVHRDHLPLNQSARRLVESYGEEDLATLPAWLVDDAWKCGATLTERQEVFMEHFDDPEVFWLFYGGAVGGGKSFTLAHAVVKYMLDFPGCELWLGRKHLTDLEKTTAKQLHSCMLWLEEERGLPYEYFRKTYNYKVYNCENPHEYSEVQLFSCEDPDSFQGANIDCVFVDEATQISEASRDQLLQRIRGSIKGSKHGWPRKLVGACNPAPGWVKELIVDPHNSGLTGKGASDIEDPILASRLKKTRFIFSSIDDNPFLPEGFKDQVLSTGGEEQRKAVEGDWSFAEGQVYTQFSKALHVRDFDADAVAGKPSNMLDWKLSYDWARNHPSAGLAAVMGLQKLKNKEGQEVEVPSIFIRHELVITTDVIAPYGDWFAQFIPRIVWGDKTITQQWMMSNAVEQFQAHNVILVKANEGPKTDKSQGISTVQTLLSNCQIVIHPECHQTIRSLENYSYKRDPRRPGQFLETPSTSYEDPMDALRYLVINVATDLSLAYWSGQAPGNGNSKASLQSRSVDRGSSQQEQARSNSYTGGRMTRGRYCA